MRMFFQRKYKEMNSQLTTCLLDIKTNLLMFWVMSVNGKTSVQCRGRRVVISALLMLLKCVPESQNARGMDGDNNGIK